MELIYNASEWLHVYQYIVITQKENREDPFVMLTDAYTIWCSLPTSIIYNKHNIIMV